MAHTMTIEQNKALALQHASELTRESSVEFGLSVARLDAVEAEGVPDQDYTMVVLVAELACALAHEREARKALGVAVDELYDRVETLETPTE